MKLILMVGVNYEPNGESEDRLVQRLADLAKHAAMTGGLTGEGPAEVKEWTYAVRAVNTGGPLCLDV